MEYLGRLRSREYLALFQYDIGQISNSAPPQKSEKLFGRRGSITADTIFNAYLVLTKQASLQLAKE